jgi:hypothetical protein
MNMILQLCKRDAPAKPPFATVLSGRATPPKSGIAAIRSLLAIFALSAPLAVAALASAQSQTIPQPSKGSSMPAVTFGENSKLIALPSERGSVRAFFRDVLQVPQTRESERADNFQLGPHFYMSVVYDEDAPSPEAQRKSIWLELRTADVDAMKAKILAGGGRKIDFWDKEHFYFQAPGGQVFRLIADGEDMSKWQR